MNAERDPAGTGGMKRRLDLSDAVVIGLGSMIGAGIFAALGPAADAAGSGLLLALALASVVAYCNAMSSARLAALYPRSGGTYVYGRERLGTSGATWPAGRSSSARQPPARPWPSRSAPISGPTRPTRWPWPQ